MLIAALRPARSHRLIAIIAVNETAQREVLVDILARRSVCCALEARQNALMSGKADQRLMLPLPQAHAPTGRLYEPCVNWALKNFCRLCDAHQPSSVALGKVGLGFEEPRHLALRTEAPRGITLKGFGDYRGNRLIPYKQLSMSSHTFKTVADGRMKDVVAFLNASGHFLNHLTAVLLALKLTLSGDHSLDEQTFRCVLKLEVQTFNASAAISELAAQLEMKLSMAGEALGVVENDDIGLTLLGI